MMLCPSVTCRGPVKFPPVIVNTLEPVLRLTVLGSIVAV